MTTQHYSHESRLIRWAYLFEEAVPRQTSTCALFWRRFVMSPIKIVACAIPICLVAALLVWVTLGWYFWPEAYFRKHQTAAPFPTMLLFGMLGAKPIILRESSTRSIEAIAIPIVALAGCALLRNGAAETATVVVAVGHPKPTTGSAWRSTISSRGGCSTIRSWPMR